MRRAWRWVGDEGRWDVLAALAYTVVSLFIYATSLRSHVPGSDGHYTWMYARSLAYDGDLDFTNDYGLCGDPFGIGWTTPAHRPANLFYVGPALFWTPLVWVLKHFVHGEPRVAGGCVGPIPTLVLALSSLAGGITVLATSAVLRRIVSARLAAVTTLMATLGGLLIFYTAMSASYSHAYDAMCLSLYLWALVVLREERRAERFRAAGLMLAGVLLGVAILQRSSNAVFFWLAPLAFARSRAYVDLRRAILPTFTVGVVALATGLVPLALINRAIYGRLSLYAHGPHFLHPGHGHPFLMLFDQRGGLFAWAPLLWIAAIGVVPLVRRRDMRWLVVPLLACGAFELYLSSCALDWQGARRLTNLTPLFALAMAPVFERVARFLSSAPRRLEYALAFLVLAAVGWSSGVVCGGFANDKIAWDQPISSAERYGDGQAAVLSTTERVVGPLSALPAAWIFAARYGLRPSAFPWAAHPKWYSRDMRTLEYDATGFPFVATEARGQLRGFHVYEDRDVGCMTGRDAALVLAVQWPVATRARIVYDAVEPDTLSVASRSFFGFRTPWANGCALPAGKRRKAFLDVRGGFDSGILEIDFAHSGGSENLCFHGIDFVDDTHYPAAPEAKPSPPLTVWHATSYGSDPGGSPSIALGAGGAWQIELHEASRGQLQELVGRRGEFQQGAPFEMLGYRPRLAASGDAVVEVDQESPGPSALEWRVGEIARGASEPRVAWSARAEYGSGEHPSIAAIHDRVFEIHTEPGRGSALSFRSGVLAGSSVAWGHDEIVGAGCEPAIAASDSWVVEVHEVECGRVGLLGVRVGKRVEDRVEWGPVESEDAGAEPTIALAGSTLVEAHQEKADPGALWMKLGAIDSSGKIAWTYRSHYDDGAHPFVALDPSTGVGIEAHQGEAALSSLWSHDVDLAR